MLHTFTSGVVCQIGVDVYVRGGVNLYECMQAQGDLLTHKGSLPGRPERQTRICWPLLLMYQSCNGVSEHQLPEYLTISGSFSHNCLPWEHKSGPAQLHEQHTSSCPKHRIGDCLDSPRLKRGSYCWSGKRPCNSCCSLALFRLAVL